MHDGLAGLRHDHLGNELAVAGGVVAFEAQQARRPFPNQDFRLRQLRLRPVGRHVFAEDRFHPFGMTGAHSVASEFRRAEALQVDVANPVFIQRRRQLALGKPGF